MPWDEDQVGSVLRDMLSAGTRPPAPLTAAELRRKVRPRMIPRMDTKAVVAVAALVALFAVVVAAGPLGHRGSGPGVPSTTSDWFAHSAYGLQISAPKSWTVDVFGQCPDSGRPGTLFIGTSAFVDSCPDYASNTSQVDMFNGGTPLDPDSPGTHAIRVNGLAVLSSPSGAAVHWYVPSRQVAVTGSGPTALAVMDTLAPASRHALAAVGQVDGTEYLVALTRVPVSGTITARRQGSRTALDIDVVDGRFTFGGRPGRYTVVGRDGNAECPTVTVDVRAGRTVDAPPILCQGE